MNVGEKLFHFLARLILDRFCGTVTIRFESGKVTHVETETRRMWQYKDLPAESDVPAGTTTSESHSWEAIEHQEPTAVAGRMPVASSRFRSA